MNFPLASQIALLVPALLGIYLLILLIILAHKGIKALDIYINEKTNKDNKDKQITRFL